MSPIRNIYAYAQAGSRRSRNERQLDRVDADIGRRLLNEQEYVYIVMDEFEFVRTVCAGRRTANLIQATIPGSYVVRYELLFMNDLLN